MPVVVTCREEDGFRLSPDALESAITPRTRWLLLCALAMVVGCSSGIRNVASSGEVRSKPIRWRANASCLENEAVRPGDSREDLTQRCAKAGRHDLPVHVLLETHGALRDAYNIAALPQI